MSNLPAIKARVWVERFGMIVHSIAVEIGPARLPVIGVLCEPDVFVRLELDEFEGAGADRVGAHLARRHMAGINRRHAGREQHQKRRLRPLQHKGHGVIAVGHDIVEIAIPRLARVEPQLVGRFAGQQIPGAFDVVRGKRLAVMPFDALAQLKAEPGVIGVPRPAFGQFGLDELRAVLLLVLVEQDQVVEDAHERRHRPRSSLPRGSRRSPGCRDETCAGSRRSSAPPPARPIGR